MSNTVFLEAVQQGNMQLVSQMLQQEPALAQAQTENGLSALLLAAYYGHPQIASLLAWQAQRPDPVRGLRGGRRRPGPGLAGCGSRPG